MFKLLTAAKWGCNFFITTTKKKKKKKIPTKSPKSKDSLFTVINDKERQEILTLKKLELAYVWYFNLKNDWNN